jgi:hypothetical protein
MCTAVNSYLMTASNKAGREVLCKCFKAPVAGWYTPGSQYSDAHLFEGAGASDCEPVSFQSIECNAVISSLSALLLTLN